MELITILKAPNQTGQPARLEEEVLTFDQAMAGTRSRHSLCYNPSPGGEDEPARGLPGAPTKDNNIFTPSPPVSRAQTPALTLAPPPVPSSTEKRCQQLLKTYAATVKLLEQNHAPGPCEQPFKAWFSNLYYVNSHMDYYHFCQQCENHFETAGASGPNRILFAASFLRGSVVQRWHQHKNCSKASEVPMT